MNQDIKLVIDELNQIEDADYIVIYSAVTLLETLGNKVAQQAAEIESLRISYDSACCLVAQLHEAVMGKVVGPHHGVVEDVRNKVAEQDKQIQQLQMALADTEALEAGTAERCCRWRESHKMSQAKVIEKSAVIEKLRSVLQFYMDNGICEPLYYKAKEALVIPTDSKQILADWMREQLGEPVFYQHESGAISTNDIDMNAGKRTALVRLPECLK